MLMLHRACRPSQLGGGEPFEPASLTPPPPPLVRLRGPISCVEGYGFLENFLKKFPIFFDFSLWKFFWKFFCKLYLYFMRILNSLFFIE